jgi:hypothetical protein
VRRPSLTLRLSLAAAVAAAAFFADGGSTWGYHADVINQPPPCKTAVKGRVLSVSADGSSVTLEGGKGKHPVSSSAAAAVRALKPGTQVTLGLDCRSRPPVVTSVVQQGVARATPDGRPTPIPPDRQTTVLLATDDACKLTVDFKPWGDLKAGDRKELKLSSGDEHQLEATTADGRTWKEKVKASGGQMIVEITFGKPVATVAEYDAQAAKVCAALEALKVAGLELDKVLRNKKFKFHEADSAAVSAASTSWTRELAVLKDLVPPSERTQATTDLSALDTTVQEYAELLVKALQTAQEKNTILGEAGVIRDKAQALRPQLHVPPATARLLPSCGSASAAR